jgi:hypothetical protein
MKCIKDWYLNGELIYKNGWNYPVVYEIIHGDKRIIGYKIASENVDSEEARFIWFWSGSEYFDIPFLG